MNKTYDITYSDDDWKDSSSSRIIFTAIYISFMIANIYGIVRYTLKAQILIIAIMVSNLIAISGKFLCNSINSLARVGDFIYLFLNDPDEE